YKSKGLTTVRMPVRWKRLQPTDKGALDATEMGRIDAEVALARERGMRLILDPHDYANRNGHKIGSPEVPNAVFADFWGRLAARYKGESHVVFGLMNEPFSIGTAQWLGAANAAIGAIRKSGAPNLILVPGVSWTGAHSWYSSGNAEAMTGVVDPGDNFAFEVHQYFDKDSSGTSDTCVSETVGADRLKKFTAWMKEHGYRGLLGEFGVARNDLCYKALDNALSYIDDNRDVWLGWTYWAGGAWWGEYAFTVEPTEKFTKDRPQMKYLVKHATP
ncbi:MAG: glycoside hydrolase family 5 protein, partial [Myxococcales bacterium]